MPLETTKYDTADYLRTRDDVVSYLEAAFEDGDPALIALAMGNVARSEGMSEIAKATGLTRASLYKALSAEGNPEFATVLKVIQALGLKLTIAPSVDSAAA